MEYSSSNSEISWNQPGCRQVDSVQASKLIGEQNALVVDVREPHEFATGRIPDARLIPLRQMGSHLESLREHDGRPIILSCRTGSRSEMACRFLRENGLDNVYNLASGFLGWQSSNLSVSR